MRLRGTNRNFRRVSPRVPFNPRKLFRNSEQGVHYDPSDFSTMFQDSAGTTPVTAVEQPVGLMLDKRLGLVLGSELVTDAEFNDASKWAFVQPSSGSVSISGGKLSISSLDGTYCQAAVFPFVPAVINRAVQYEISVESVSGSGIAVSYGGALGPAITTPGVHRGILIATSTAALLVRRFTNTSTSAVVLSCSVKELPGNHAFQTTAIDRPILRNRYNLLTQTDTFSDWTLVNTSRASHTDGSTIVTKLIGNQSGFIYKTTPQIPVGSSVKASVLVKRGNTDLFGFRVQAAYPQGIDIVFNTVTGAVAFSFVDTFTDFVMDPVVQDADGFWKVAFTFKVAGSSMGGFLHGPAGIATRGWDVNGNLPNNSFVYAKGASLVPADQASLPYQRVNTATDYDADPSKFPLYLQANGTNTGMQTNSIDFSSTDKVTVFAGVRKLSDVATGVIVDLSSDPGTATSTFSVLAPSSNGSNSYRATSRGFTFSTAAAAGTGIFAVAPDSAVLCGLASIAADFLKLRRNGVDVESSATDQGTGGYGNYPLYLFRRGGTSLPFNGNFYGLLIRGALTSDPDTLKMEKWLSFKTGVQL